MSNVTLTINGHPVTVSDGTTILEAARQAGTSIPTLCHFDGLGDVGACRLCLVELAGSSALSAACVTRAVAGMEVQTHSARLQSYRRMILELLFAERNHICSVCVASGNCELQQLAGEHDITHVRFAYRFPSYDVDLSHPQFGVDHNRCILCTRCVRVCAEIEGAHTWDVAGRGVDCEVITDFHQPWGEAATCTSCGKCVALCPTGALFPRGSTVGGIDRQRGRVELLLTTRGQQ